MIQVHYIYANFCIVFVKDDGTDDNLWQYVYDQYFL